MKHLTLKKNFEILKRRLKKFLKKPEKNLKNEINFTKKYFKNGKNLFVTETRKNGREK